MLAVDPSSRRTGGSLLGDRARIAFDPADDGVFIRSTAAGGRLGGLAPATRARGAARSRPRSTSSSIETVGVGQSETDVAEVADTVAVVVQPGSGDVAAVPEVGIMEIPDVLVVTKADLGEVALRARRDLNAALRSLGAARRRSSPSPRSPPSAGSTTWSTRSTRTARLDLARAARSRPGARRALADFAAEHGERGPARARRPPRRRAAGSDEQDPGVRTCRRSSLRVEDGPRGA